VTPLVTSFTVSVRGVGTPGTWGTFTVGSEIAAAVPTPPNEAATATAKAAVHRVEGRTRTAEMIGSLARNINCERALRYKPSVFAMMLR
jgi:hypothetical protein